MKSILQFFSPRSEIATESHIHPCMSPGNVGVNLSALFKEPGAGAGLEGSKENDSGSAVDRETGVLSSASVPSIPTSELLETEEPIREQNLLQEAIRQSGALIDDEKYQLLTTEQDGLADDDLDTRYFCVTGGRKRKQIRFQRRWLQDYKWLRYGVDKDHQGRWCLPCILFLSGSEKANLGAFVCTPFTNYNKSKELCEKHTKKEYHIRAIDRAYAFNAQILLQGLIYSQLMDCNARNFRFNSEVLPSIVEGVLLCARQRIALQAHQQDRIDFALPAIRNEGNFIVVLRLLAKNKPMLHEHLTSGPKNAKYTSKTIQNKILEIAADQVREFY